MMERINEPVTGAWKLLMLNPEGLKHFRLDQDHFKLSWFAVPLTAPFFLLSLLSVNQMLAAAAEPVTPLWLGLLGFLVSWAAVSAMLVGALMLSGRRQGALPILLIFNWLQLVVTVAIVPLWVIPGFGLVPAAFAPAFIYLGLIVSLAVKGHFLWRVIGPAWVVIVAIVGGEIAIGIAVEHIFSWFGA